MCNRYQPTRFNERIRMIFENAPDGWLAEADHKYDTVYPKSNVPVVLSVNGEKMFKNFRWGIHPSWARSPGQILTNSKSEEVFTKPTWKESFERRRCVMPADSFYEPATVDGKKHQVRFELKSGAPFVFAALWEKDHAAQVNSCSLLTCEPNEIVGEVHNRMPVLLPTELIDFYLSVPPTEVRDLRDILRPWPAEDMTAAFDSTST